MDKTVQIEENPIQLGEIIENQLIGLLAKEENKTIQNIDFTEAWSYIVMLPLSRLEYLIRESNHTKKGYTREQAIIYGLLTRIMHLLLDARNIICARLLTRELATFYQRAIFESIVNMLYLVKKNDDSYRSFIYNGLKAEIEFEDTICNNISKGIFDNAEDSIKEYQAGLLDSIRRTYRLSGTSSEEIRKFKQSFPSFRDRADFVGYGDAYYTFKIESHAVHGDWVDLYENHLISDDGFRTFQPKFEEKESDIRQLNPLLQILYEALISFINNYVGHGIDNSIIEELEADNILIKNFDRMHFNYLHKRPLLEGTDD